MSIHDVSRELAVAGLKHVVITAADPFKQTISSLKRSQFQLTIRNLKRLGYAFPDDKLVCADVDTSRSSFAFLFTKDDARYGLSIITGNDGVKLTAALFPESTPRVTYGVEYKHTEDVDTGVAKRVKDLMDKLENKIAQQSTATAADKIKVTTKINFPKADFVRIDEMEGTTLRGRSVLEDPTKTKICNSISRRLANAKIYGHFPQRPGYDMLYKFTVSNDKIEPGKQYLLSEMGKNDKIETMKVQLVDKETRKPLYSLDDITSGEVELIEVK